MGEGSSDRSGTEGCSEVSGLGVRYPSHSEPPSLQLE